MGVKLLFNFFAFILLTGAAPQARATSASEQICGRWESSEKNLIVQVNKVGNKFIARIIWFKSDDGRPMESWTDKHNPDKLLRNRKILGMEVLNDLNYQADTDSWEDGMIYDAKHGRDWNASAYIDRQGM